MRKRLDRLGYVAGKCERDNSQRWCEERDKREDKGDGVGILKKRMTKEGSTTEQGKVSLTDGS